MAKLDSWLLPPDVTHALGWALIHSLWQCVGLAALAAVLMALSRRPPVRYLIATAALAAMLAAPFTTFLILLKPAAPVETLTSANSAPKLFAVAPRVNPLGAAATPLNNARALAFAASRTRFVSPRFLSGDFLAPDILPWLVRAWLCGVALFGLRFAGGLLLLEYKRPGPFTLPGPRILALCRELQHQLGLNRAIRYLECTWLQAPAVIGWLRPIVLLPVAALTGLSEAQLHAVIAHELAHIKRLDAFVNLLQILIEALLFYHPAIWWLNSRIRAERELCCDEIAISLTGDRLEYARALTLMAEWEAAPRLAMAANRGPLTERVFHILGRKKFASGRRMLGWTACLLVLAGAFGAHAWFGTAHPSVHVQASVKNLSPPTRIATDEEVAPEGMETENRPEAKLVASRTLALPPLARMLRAETLAVPQLVAVADPPAEPAPDVSQPTQPIARTRGPVCAPPSLADQADLIQVPSSDLRTVPVAVNGQAKQFLLAVGTGPTEISQEAVADLGLPSADRTLDATHANGYQSGDMGAFTNVSYLHAVPLVNVNGSRSIEDYRPRVRVAQFTLGGATGHDLAFAVAKDPQMGKAKPYDGLMTGDFFRQYDVELDFAKGKLSYFAPTACNDPDQVTYWPHAAVAMIPMTELGGKLQVEVTIEGHAIPAVIDTSSPRTVMRRDVAELMLGLKADTPEMTKDGDVTDGVGLPVYRHTIAEISFAGGVTALNVPAEIQSNSMFRDINRTPVLGQRATFIADPRQRIPALSLGMDVLSQLHLYAAPGKQTLYVTAAE
jgi:beta-lactamase regulating signal transducer with metallopeptidase domain